jgi:acyl-CoA synthetase (AMP-forming)/AMP-acid ligase II
VAVTILERILAGAARCPSRPAIIFQDRAITHRELGALVHAAARRLHDEGVRPGEVVALSMGHGPVHAVVQLALARLGAVTLSLFQNLPAEHRSRAIGRYAATRLVTDAPEAAQATVPVVVVKDLHARGDEGGFAFTAFVPAAEAPLRIGLTSGTTGDQKAFLHTHGEFSRRVERRFPGEALVPRAIPPLLHITSGLQLAWHALAAGGALVFPTGGDARGMLNAIGLYAATHVSLPPADLAALCTLLPLDSEPAFPSLRRVNVVGATPSPELLELACRKFSPFLFAGYSLSEVGMVAEAEAATLAGMPGAVGRIAAGARVKVAGDGEIIVAVDGMPQGYHGPDAALPGFRDGWFHTGDHGRVSADGWLYVEGRRDNLLNVGGHKVAPEYVESILARHPSVADVAVHAQGDAMTGTALVAVIVPRGRFDPQSLEAFARQALGRTAPARYCEAAAIPRNAMGKIERAMLPSLTSGVTASMSSAR